MHRHRQHRASCTSAASTGRQAPAPPAPASSTGRQAPAPAAPALARAVYAREDAQRAWERRRADLADIADLDDILNQVDARAKELQERTTAILAAETDH